MKRSKILALAVALMLVLTMVFAVACDKTPLDTGKVPTPQEGQFAAFDKSNPCNVVIKNLTTIPNITVLSIGGITFGSSDFTYSNGTLTIKAAKLNELSVKARGADRKEDMGRDIYYETSGTTMTHTYKLTTKLHVATMVIMNKEDFKEINKNISETSYYILGNDINFLGVDDYITPIGNLSLSGVTTTALGGSFQYDEKPFEGVFEGAGHKLSNIAIYSRESENKAHNVYPFDPPKTLPTSTFGGCGMAIFSNVGKTGVLRNFAVEGAKVRGSQISAVVAGACDGAIDNVIVDATSEVRIDWTEVDFNCFGAGFVGIVGGPAEITNCVTSAKVWIFNGNTNNWENNAQLIRAFAGKTWGTITNCYALNQSITYRNCAAEVDGVKGPGSDFPGNGKGIEYTVDSYEGVYEPWIAGWINYTGTFNDTDFNGSVLGKCAFIIIDPSYSGYVVPANIAFTYLDWNPSVGDLEGLTTVAQKALLMKLTRLADLLDPENGVSEGKLVDSGFKTAAEIAALPGLKITFGIGYVAA